MVNEETQNLAERIANLLQNGKEDTGALVSLRLSLEKISERLDRIESQISSQSINSQSAIQTPQLFHASQEKFTSLDEISYETINNLKTEKACPYEPTGKPCDHCAMCSSRGF